MLIEVSVEDFRRDPDSMLDRVQLDNAEVVVTEGGKVIAALVNPGLFERTRRIHDRFEEITANISEDFQTF